MKLKISKIPAEGIDLSAETPTDPWFSQAVTTAFQDSIQEKGHASIALHIGKTCDNVSVRGVAQVDLSPECVRCLERFPYTSPVSVNLVLAPLRGEDGELIEDGEVVSEDEEFSFYRGDEINLEEIVREALILSITLQYLCKESCKRICQRCGENLNLTPCGCK
jgi:uncharacterized protein